MGLLDIFRSTPKLPSKFKGSTTNPEVTLPDMDKAAEELMPATKTILQKPTTVRSSEPTAHITFREEAILPDIISDPATPSIKGITTGIVCAIRPLQRPVGVGSDMAVYFEQAPIDLLTCTSGASYVYNFKDKRYFALARRCGPCKYVYRVHEDLIDAGTADPAVENIGTSLWNKPTWEADDIVRQLKEGPVFVIPITTSAIRFYTDYYNILQTMLSGLPVPERVVQTDEDPYHYLAPTPEISQAPNPATYSHGF